MYGECQCCTCVEPSESTLLIATFVERGGVRSREKLCNLVDATVCTIRAQGGEGEEAARTGEGGESSSTSTSSSTRRVTRQSLGMRLTRSV
mgnify:CR=1 FL=1